HVDQDVRALHQLVAHAPADLTNMAVVPLAAFLYLSSVNTGLLLFAIIPLLVAAAGFARLRSPRMRPVSQQRDAALEALSAGYGEFAQNPVLARQFPGGGIQKAVLELTEAFAR